MEKSKVIEKLFYYIVASSYLLIPVSFLVAKIRVKDSIPLLLSIYAIICFFFLWYFDSFPYETQKYLQSSYTFFEYFVFATVFWVNFKKPKIRNIILILTILFLTFQIFYLFTGKVKRIDTVPIGLETIIILFYIILFFYQFSKTVTTSYIYNHYLFWISVGILIYLSGCFFFFILFDHLTKSEVESFGNLTYLAEIIKNVLFSIAIFSYSKNHINTKPKDSTIPYLDMDMI